jgi:phage tail protein X
MVVQGETWDSVARRVYGPGSETLMSLLITANPEFRETAVFSGGEILTVPPKPADHTTGSKPPWAE